MSKTDTETIKKILMLAMNALRNMEREVLVHAAVIEALKQEYGIDSEMDQMLESARGLDTIERQLHEKYDEPLEKMLGTIDAVESETQLHSFLERSAPKGRPN